MSRQPSPARAVPAPARPRHTPLDRFRSMLSHESFGDLAGAPLFQRWVRHTEWLLGHQDHCTSSTAARAMFELHAAENGDVEQFIGQINLLLEAGRDEPDLGTMGRAMIVGLLTTLVQSRAV